VLVSEDYRQIWFVQLEGENLINADKKNHEEIEK
jgi:hypothetical protein